MFSEEVRLITYAAVLDLLSCLWEGAPIGACNQSCIVYAQHPSYGQVWPYFPQSEIYSRQPVP